MHVEVADVAIGGSFTALLDVAGDVYTWGTNSYAELGLGDVQTRVMPTLALGGRNVT